VVKTLARACLLLLAGLSVCGAGDLEAAQRALKRMGYYAGDVDGRYGSQTAAAIRRFQLAEKLRVSGRLDEDTARRLGIAKPFDPFAGGPLAGAGEASRESATRSAQRTLKQLGFYGGEVDGKAGAGFVRALRAWQVSEGLPPSGRLDARALRGLGVRL
jgi:peptidoglycan hydrolase-like protein with peptidoglycan-binding domain